MTFEQDMLAHLKSAQTRLGELGLQSSIQDNKLIFPLSNRDSYEYRVGKNHGKTYSSSVGHVFALSRDGREIYTMGRDEGEVENSPDYSFDPLQDPIQISDSTASDTVVSGLEYFADIISWGEPYLPAVEKMKRLQTQL